MESVSLYIIPRQVTLQVFLAPEGRRGIPISIPALTTSIQSLDWEISLPNLMLTLQLRSFDPGGSLATHMSVCDRIIKPPSLLRPPASSSSWRSHLNRPMMLMRTEKERDAMKCSIGLLFSLAGWRRTFCSLGARGTHLATPACCSQCGDMIYEISFVNPVS